MIKEIVSQIKSRKLTAQEVVKGYFNRIKEKDSEIQAFLTVTKNLALDRAQQIDEQVLKGKDAGSLSGVPVAVKDNILVAGERCTAGSRILENYTAPYDAYVIEKIRQAGAVILGKTNLDEFAMGTSTENSAFFSTRNPLDTTRVPGGSSGGSAAAVAAQMAPAALGSDTGGSVRQPAAFCGVVGFEPTYGAVSRRGLIAMCSSMDVIGPLAQKVEDIKLIFKVISGQDLLDATSFDLPRPDSSSLKLKGIKLGLPREFWEEKGIDRNLKEVLEKNLKVLARAGVNFEKVSLPLATKVALACYYVIMPAEISSNLARYDGVKYGLSRPGKRLLERYLESRGAGFGLEPKRRILLGTYVLSQGYIGRYYHKAQSVRGEISSEFKKVFRKIDFLLTPITPAPAFKLGEKVQDPVAMYLEDIFTVSANLAGIPAVSLPAGRVRGLPVGLQLMGPQKSDWRLLNLAERVEQVLTN
jgi:aspartyl-tRNA(Asn)/glutamyl-tRNA(Gln) amidotransferase subunit A